MKQYSDGAWRGVPFEFKDANGNDADPIKAIDALTAALDQKMTGFATELKSATDRFDAEIVKLKRPGTEAKSEKNDIEAKAFENFIRKGPQALSADEVKALNVSTDADGGYLAPDTFVAELLRNVVQFSPVRSLARMANISSGVAVLPRRMGGMTAAWVGETEQRTETSVTFGENRFTVAEIAAYVDVSNQLIEDSVFDIAAELAFEFSEEFGTKEASAFVNGDAMNKPSGFMANPNIDFTPSGDSTKVTADGIIDLYHALPTPYRSKAVFAMNSATLGAVRKLKTTAGEYLLSMSGLNGAPGTTLLGRPVVEMPDMPDVAAGNFPVVFADFGNYRIFDRVALSILRDPYSQAGQGKTRFHGRRRVAGGVAKPEGFRKLKIVAS